MESSIIIILVIGVGITLTLLYPEIAALIYGLKKEVTENKEDISFDNTEKPSDIKKYYSDRFFPSDRGTVSRDELSKILGDIDFDDDDTINALIDYNCGWYLRKDFSESDIWEITLSLIRVALDDHDRLVEHIKREKPKIRKEREQRQKEKEEHEKRIAPRKEYIKQNIDEISKRVDELLDEGKKLYERYEYPYDKANEYSDYRTEVRVEPSHNLYELKGDAIVSDALENLCELSGISEEISDCYHDEIFGYVTSDKPEKHIVCVFEIRKSLRHNNFWPDGLCDKVFIVIEEQKWVSFTTNIKQNEITNMCRENNVIPLIKYPLEEEEKALIKEKYHDPINQENYKWNESWGWYHDEDRGKFELVKEKQ